MAIHWHVGVVCNYERGKRYHSYDTENCFLDESAADAAAEYLTKELEVPEDTEEGNWQLYTAHTFLCNDPKCPAWALIALSNDDARDEEAMLRRLNELRGGK